jgi:hypothetical protein
MLVVVADGCDTVVVIDVLEE